ncbi:MATE family efflux transporter [Tropicimonas sp. S265A]|uniref:MATE family efflux transporter n=1 Tax=Tropicimonas sp. S265A TaxID=3415134 RepID=UPI003C7DA360
MSLGILAVLSVGIADAYFLGRLGGEPLAAIGYVYPVTSALSSLAIGLSAGANASVSQAIGRKEGDVFLARLSVHAFALGLTLSVVVALCFFAVHVPLFRLMGASDAVLIEIEVYVPIWAASFPFLVLLMITNAVLRAHGQAALASVFMIVAAAMNIALNPVLIFGFGPIEGLGTSGAAAATFAGRVIAAGLALWFAIRARHVFLCGGFGERLKANFGAIASVGGPAAFSNAINPAGMALVTAAVATLGDAAVAGFGAATRIQSVALVVLLALSSGIGPVVGQNWGAEAYERAKASVVQAWLFCLGYGFVLGLCLFAFADPLARLIASDTDAARFTAEYLSIVGWSFAGYGILVTANAAMNARSKALYSMSLSLGRIFLVYLPLAWLGVSVLGYSGILLAAFMANIAAIAGAVYLCYRAELLPAKTNLARTVGS